MNPQWTKFGAILMIVAMFSFAAWPVWQWINLNAASAEMERQARAAYEKHTALKPAWNIAMHDGVLSEAEAKEILDAAKSMDDAAPADAEPVDAEPAAGQEAAPAP